MASAYPATVRIEVEVDHQQVRDAVTDALVEQAARASSPIRAARAALRLALPDLDDPDTEVVYAQASELLRNLTDLVDL